MDKLDLRKSVLLKTLCYILIPIIAVLILLSITYLIMVYEIGDVRNAQSYYETESFSNYYYSMIYRNIELVKEDKQRENESREIIDSEDTNEEFMQEEEIYSINNYNEKIEVQYDRSDNYSQLEKDNEIIKYENYRYMNTGFYYLIIDNTTGVAYTNFECTSKTDTIQEIKELIGTNNMFWNSENDSINTSISMLSAENINYFERYRLSDGMLDISIFTSIVTDGSGESDNYIINRSIEFDIFKEIDIKISNLGEVFYILLVTMIILLLLMCIYIICSIGHKKGHEGIFLNWIDKIPLEIIGVTYIIFICIIAEIFNNTYTYLNMHTQIMFISCIICFAYIITAITGVTFIKRIKGRVFIKNTVMYKIWEAIKNILKKINRAIFGNTRATLKLGVFYWLFIISSIILCLTGIGIILAFALWVYIFIAILEDINKFKEIKNGLEEVYMGNTTTRLDDNKYKGQLKDMAIYINDISDGFENAVQESLKSEKLKTELITNVSHDIKTPLTSIINYVDLLKKENIENEKVKEYLDVLDNKSQRLKKLTEDLVEASKVSSGNVNLNMEKINVSELIRQTTGEYEEKFNEKKLQIITEIPDKDVFINADSQYMYRVIENLFSNISKYALEASRVYVNINVKNKIVKIDIKNISKEKLNITADELMQRFVRGDKSRATEGSGLGLSISQSLTKIQNGKFDMQIDGDLFKVILEFDEV